MLGSHNSMSYLPIVNWWQRWQKHWCCCQSKTIKEQLAAGVRFFDIRVRFIDNTWHFVHNKIDFGPVNYNIFRLLNGQGEPVYIRFILDERKKPANSDYYIYLYTHYMAYILSTYENIVPYEVLSYWNWKDYKDDIGGTPNQTNCRIKSLEEMHASVSNSLLDYILHGTRVCRPTVTADNLGTYASALVSKGKVLLMDFV